MPRDRDLENEMNGEIAEITSTGRTKFHHRSGTHDDRLWAVALAVYGARINIEPYHPTVLLGKRRDLFGRHRGPSWTDWLRQIRGETMQDKHDQTLTRTDLSGRVLRRDQRALIAMEAPPVRSIPWGARAGMVERRICPVCGSSYVHEPGRDSLCGHVKHDGTILP